MSLNNKNKSEDLGVKYFTVTQMTYFTGFNDKTIKKRLGNLEPVKTKGRAKYYDSKEAFKRVCVPEESKAQYDLNKERARLAAMQANEKKLDYLRKKGSTLLEEDVLKEYSKLAVETKTKFMSIPTKVGPHLTNLSTAEDVRDKLMPFISEVLESIANESTD